MADQYERIRVLVGTEERNFRGFVYKPVKDADFRLSDHLNTYGREFICLSDVYIADRGQAYMGERHEFVAVAVSSITHITPLRDDE
jgi:hypothetical protein